MSSRSSGYTVSEDVLLCQVYLDISQDSITGRYQSANDFWSRVELKYNELRQQHLEYRNTRSVRSRINTIIAEVRRLNGCLKQVENLNPSGALEEDILDQAKLLFMQEHKYRKGFKFDHVWNMVKNFEKFKDNVPTARQIARGQNHVNFDSSQSDNPTPESPISASPGLSSSFPNLDDENFGGTSSKRPIGVKKAKLKIKNDEQMSAVINSFKEENRQLIEMFKKTTLGRQEQLDIQRQNLAFKERKEENKILLKDLNFIIDPNVREYFRAEQLRIIQKRNQQQSSSSAFGHYFDDIGGSASGLPDY